MYQIAGKGCRARQQQQSKMYQIAGQDNKAK
jgi:hypothetical protein